MNKSKILTLALLSLSSLVLTACTLQDLPLIGRFFGNSNEPVTLTYWGLWEDPDVMQKIINKYQEAHPNVTINYEDRSILPVIDYKERVFTRSADAKVDIMRVHTSWMPRIKDSLTPAPSNLIKTEEFNGKYYPVAIKDTVFEDKVYGIPAYYDGLVLVYNKAHFAEINQTQAPTAWEEFRRIALDLTRRAGSRENVLIRAGAAMGAADNIDHFSDILGLMWSQAKVEIPSQIDSQAGQDALAFYTNFLAEDGVWDPSFPEATTAFAQGKVSMIFVPSWRVVEIINANKDIQIGVAPVPQAIPSSPASWATFWVDVVDKNSPNARVAWDFLNFVSQEEQQLQLFDEASKIRKFGTPFALTSMAGQASANEYLKPLIDTATFAKSAEIGGRAGNRKQVTALQNAVNDVLNGENPSNALKAAKEEMAQ